MSNEENELFQGGPSTAKPKFGEDKSPDKTARETAAAMAAMDVEGLVGDERKPTETGGKPRSLESMFDARQPAKPAAKPRATPPARPAARAAPARPRPVARAAVQRTPSKPPTPAANAGATHAAVESPPPPKKRGLLARLFGWIFGR